MLYTYPMYQTSLHQQKQEDAKMTGAGYHIATCLSGGQKEKKNEKEKKRKKERESLREERKNEKRKTR